MFLRDKKIGVWGYGLVGKSAVDYCIKQGAHVSVLEKRQLSSDELAQLEQLNVPHVDESVMPDFLATHDYIIPSPGVDLRPWYKRHQEKWLAEVDLFQDHNAQNVIAITGSVGKTTITSLLHQLYATHGYQSAAIGNIGVPLLSVIDQINQLTFAELSSFQLEHVKRFAPNIAIISNVHENHFDRHATFAEYVQAKCNIFAHQRAGQWVLLPWELRNIIDLSSVQSNVAWHTDQQLSQIKKTFDTSFVKHSLYCLNEDIIIKYQNQCSTFIASLKDVPRVTFTENLVIIAATTQLLALWPVDITQLPPALSLEHRLEYVATHNGVTYFNDSKSTTPASTLAAVNTVGAPTILFLGGLSKGVDRTHLIERCASSVRAIYCFGKEANDLLRACNRFNIAASAHKTLEEAFEHLCTNKQPGDRVLFSPAGSSFDLFANYQERGNRFKQLVHRIIQKN